MRVIDPETWPRRDHFSAFENFGDPYFDMTVPVDLTELLPVLADHGVGFTPAIVYVQARAANGIPEFRTRIREDGTIVEHDLVHPAMTVLVDDDLFSFCFLDYDECLPAFAAQAAARMAQVKERPSLEDPADRDDLLFMTAIPWVSFTSFSHPMPHNADWVPRFAWGRYYPAGDRVLIPLEVQGHHALMDGLHLGRYFQAVQGLLDDPEALLGS